MSLQQSYLEWLQSFLMVAKHYRIDVSEEYVKVFLDWEKTDDKDQTLKRIAKQLGLSLKFQAFSKNKIDSWSLPIVIELSDGQVGVVNKADGKGNCTFLFAQDNGLAVDLTIDELTKRANRILVLRPESSVADARIDDYIKPFTANWFWKIIIGQWRSYSNIILASLAANLLALSAIIFSMQLYDRVIPAQSEPTLWVLFSGVVIAIVFEFLLRLSRTEVSDNVGKRIDLTISDFVFGRALRLRNDVRPKSVGSFVSQLRELDQLREVVASSTINALADLPFVILFLLILFIIGGPLAFVAVGALPILVLPGLILQRPLARLAKEGMRESAVRNAIMIESVEGIEDIKLLRAEQRFQSQWNQVNSVSASISLRQRRITNFLLTWAQELQSVTYAGVLLIGAFLVMKGDITTGTLVGSSILASRMMGPISQWSGILARIQQAKVAYQGVSELLKKPVDQGAGKLLHRPVLFGNYQVGGVQLRYSDDDKAPALAINSLKIERGERVALLGKMGAGKSTLLQLLAGMAVPQQGNVLLDGTDLKCIDPSDVRRDVGLLSQNSRLFFGSIRDNLMVGNLNATHDELVQALQVSGAISIIQGQTKGIDYLIQEGGKGLSGGQKQALLLARTLVHNPNVLLLDEPTASIDDFTERHIVTELDKWVGNRTLIIATHRPAILSLVQRIIVVDNGCIVLDGPKDKVLGMLANPSKKGGSDEK